MSLSHSIWQFNAAKDGRSLNLSAIAQAAGMRVATIWTYHHGKARWTADVWLRCLLLAGGARVVGSQLVIDLPAGVTLEEAIPKAFKAKKR